MRKCQNINPLFKLSLVMTFIIVSNLVLAQNTDTIKINYTHDVYDTVRIFDTIVKYDTVWQEYIFDEIRVGPATSVFVSKWRNKNGEILNILTQNNFCLGLQSDFIIGRSIFSSGITYSQFNETRQFDYSIIEVDSTQQMEIVLDSYIDYDTTGVSWILYTYDSTYYEPTIEDSVTIVITDTIMQYHIDSITINYNDTVFNIIYDSTKIDTISARNFKYTYLEVPLIYKYKIAEIKNFSFNVGIGFIAGLLIKSESYYHDAETNIILVYNKADNYSFFPSLWFSLGIDYHLKDRLVVSLEPFYNPGLRSILKPDIGNWGIPDRYGLKLGLSYKF